MGDIPVKPEAGREVRDGKESEVRGQGGVALQLGNTEIIKVKLLESIQNLMMQNNKLLRAIAEKSGVDTEGL